MLHLALSIVYPSRLLVRTSPLGNEAPLHSQGLRNLNACAELPVNEKYACH